MDSGKLFYEIPDREEVMTALVESVSSDWAWVDGYLGASAEFVDGGFAAPDTILWLDRFHSIHPTYRGRVREGKTIPPDLEGILGEGKLAGGVMFHEAGYGDRDLNLAVVKRIACRYLERGYRGHLVFFSGCYDNYAYENPERVSIAFEPWTGLPCNDEEAGPQPARIKLEWNGQYGGKMNNLEPVIAACKLMDLREYKPVAQ